MHNFIRLQLPQFGGNTVWVRANDQAVAVHGTPNVSVRVPLSNHTQSFSNAACDKPDQELVVEMHAETTRSLGIRLALRPKSDPQNEDNLFALPELDASALVSVSIEDGNLVITAQGPITAQGRNNQYTLLDTPLEKMVPATT